MQFFSCAPAKGRGGTREETKEMSDSKTMRVYQAEETGGRMTVGELVKLLAEVPQETGVFFSDGDEVFEEPASGLTASRDQIEQVHTTYWHKDGETGVAYVRLVGRSRLAEGHAGLKPWSELFPVGRHIYYEGDQPKEFRQQVKEEFGFDPAADNDGWGFLLGTSDGEVFRSYGFHCPAEHLDAVYGSGRFPTGS
jgi:hypothetical protein